MAGVARRTGAREGSRGVNCRRCPVVRFHTHRTGMWRYYDWYEWFIAAGIVFGVLLLFLVLAST